MSLSLSSVDPYDPQLSDFNWTPFEDVALATSNVPHDADIVPDAPLTLSPPSNAEFDPNATNAGENGDPWAEVKGYGRMVDAAVLNSSPCIYPSHTQRQANCRDCSAVAFSRLLKGRRQNLRKESGQSTAHKADTPCLDLYLEYRAMKMAENAGKLSCKEFDEFVNNELKGQVRVCANASAKCWVKTNFCLSRDGVLYWGKGDGKQRQIKREDGSKAQGRIMRDYEAAELVHRLHQDGHCGRDTLIARIQQEGNKPPVKDIVAAWISDCTGCNHGSKKRSRDDSTPDAVSGPPPKRKKADPRKTKAAATSQAPETEERNDSVAPTPKAIPAEAAQLPSAAAAAAATVAPPPRSPPKIRPPGRLKHPPRGDSVQAIQRDGPSSHPRGSPTPPSCPCPLAPATTAELPHEVMHDLDKAGIAPLEFESGITPWGFIAPLGFKSGIAPLEFLMADSNAIVQSVENAGLDEANFNTTLQIVENAAQEYGIPENTQASPAEFDIAWSAMQDASRSSG